VNFKEMAPVQNRCPLTQRMLCGTSLKLAFRQTALNAWLEIFLLAFFAQLFPSQCCSPWEARLPSFISSRFVWRCLSSIGGYRHRPLCRRFPTSDIDISYSDIGTKYVGLNPLIPISEEFRYRHQLSFRYRTKSISVSPISRIDQSLPIDPRKILSIIINITGFEPTIFL
jgi:hypothetical protein